MAGTRSEDGTSWTFDLQRAAVHRPGERGASSRAPSRASPEGANYSTFSLTFEPPDRRRRSRRRPATPPAPTTPADRHRRWRDRPGVGAGVAFDSPPVDTGSFDLPPVSAALPDEEQGLTPVAPSVQAETAAAAGVDRRSTRAASTPRRSAIVLLLLGGGLVYLMTRQQQVDRSRGRPRWPRPLGVAALGHATVAARLSARSGLQRQERVGDLAEVGVPVVGLDERDHHELRRADRRCARRSSCAGRRGPTRSSARASTPGRRWATAAATTSGIGPSAVGDQRAEVLGVDLAARPRRRGPGWRRSRRARRRACRTRAATRRRGGRSAAARTARCRRARCRAASAAGAVAPTAPS